MTDFVQSFSTQQLLPPWHSEGAETWMYLISVKEELMQGYLDRHFNEGGPDQSPYHYEPWTNPCFGFLQVVDHPRFSSEHVRPDLDSAATTHTTPDGDPECEHWDTVRHTEVFFSFPAARYKRTPDNLIIEKKLVWIQPYYFDDNSYVMFSSREIWGSEKEMAKIQINRGKEINQLHIDVAAQGFKVFNPNSKSHSIGVMHLRMDSDAKQTTLANVRKNDKELTSMLGSLQGHLPKEWTDPAPAKTLTLPDFEINTLKQYRDVFDMHDAVYRAIIASRASHSNITEMSVFRGEHVNVDFMWSDSMKEQFVELFGLQPPDENSPWGHRGTGLHNDEGDTDWDMQSVPVDVKLAVFFRSDALFEVLGTLHTYGGGAQYLPPDGVSPEV